MITDKEQQDIINKELQDQINQLDKMVKSLNSKGMDRDTISSSLMQCRILDITSHASAGTESVHPHYLGRSPSMVFLVSKANAIVYLSTATAVSGFNDINIYIKSSENATPVLAFCLI
jgi:hypothetical protein